MPRWNLSGKLGNCDSARKKGLVEKNDGGKQVKLRGYGVAKQGPCICSWRALSLSVLSGVHALFLSSCIHAWWMMVASIYDICTEAG